MGERVAELRMPGCGDVEGYCAYQSTSGVCFVPIFRNQLAAELFAATLRNISPRWSEVDQLQHAARVNEYLKACFGEHPADHPKYDDNLSDPQEFALLRAQFLAGRVKP